MSTIFEAVKPENPKRRISDYESRYHWVVDALKQLGIPVVFAAVLLWFILARVDLTLKEISSTLHSHNASAISQGQVVEKSTNETQEIMSSIERLSQRVCFNTAKTNSERYECYK
jgi:signal transduction histidine kinase